MPETDMYALLKEFNEVFDSAFEDIAAQTRGAFLIAFPEDGLKNITLDEYIIGKGLPSFCTHVEVKTKAWANILGTTAFKFGVYYGRTKSDSRKKYRFTQKFGDDVAEAFAAVKRALLALIDDGKHLRFDAVDANPLSQTFKAKILSLYFPKHYMNVCSKEHIEALSSNFGISDALPISQQQHLLVKAKLDNPIAKFWSNPKFMAFLYNTYIRTPAERMHLKRVHRRRHSRINVDDMLENRRRIGELSENYALEWERERLLGLGYRNAEIEDHRETPACGYDFSSGAECGQKRYIEVKSAGKNRIDGGFRFFLSETEYNVSRLPQYDDQYYFYLVYYSETGSPADLEARKASELYAISDMGPNGYVVSFDREERSI